MTEEVTRRPVVLFATDHNLGSDEDKEVQSAWTNESIELLLIDWEDLTQQEELFKKYKEQKRTFVVVIRSTWNYHIRAEKFKQWLHDLELREVPLYNSCDLISWNMHKHYLFELNDWGLSTVPTLKLDSLDLTQYFTALDTNEIVIKPCISAGSHRTIRITREQIPTTNTQEIEQWMKESDYIVQPFIQELSLMFINQEHSHSLLKKPKSGAWYVQEIHGGSSVQHVCDERIVKLGRQAVEAVRQKKNNGRPILYARVDLIQVKRDGTEEDRQYLISEIEMIEPCFYFECAPEPRVAIQTFLNAIEQIVEKLKGTQ